MWEICKLRREVPLCARAAITVFLRSMSLSDVQILLCVHLLAKVGWQASDAATQLKMVEKGLGREDLAITVLIDFPFEIVGGWLAGKWARGDKPLRAWIYAFWPRLILTLVSTLVVYYFPAPPISTSFFVGLVVLTIFQSFARQVSWLFVCHACLTNFPVPSNSAVCRHSILAFPILL